MKKILISAREHNKIIKHKNTIIYNQQREIGNLQTKNDDMDKIYTEMQENLLMKDDYIDMLETKLAQIGIKLAVAEHKNDKKLEE